MSDQLNQERLELIKMRREYARKLSEAFDPFELESRPNDRQLEIIKDTEHLVFWLLGGNRSGKTQTGSRIVTWWFQENHPYQQRPPEWGTGPLQILVVGRLGEQLESEIWNKKIKPFLEPGTYKEVRTGNALQRVHNINNGNTIIFMSHHAATQAREKVQGFTSNIVWLDEMPGDDRLVSELIMRTISNRGRFYGTFTPLLKNEKIRKQVDADNPLFLKVKMSILDNPIYKGREQEAEDFVRAMCTSEAEFLARMYGEWYYGPSRVFSYDAAVSKRNPEGYHPTWRHVAVADPAASNKTGLTVWAEDPNTFKWYCVFAKYFDGAAAFDLYDSIEKELKRFYITHRITDCNPAGFYKEAIRRNEHEWLPFTEKDQKHQLIDDFNAALLKQQIFLTEWAGELEAELVDCEWSENNPDRIVNESSYHLADTARYFWARCPRPAPDAGAVLTPTQELRQAFKKKKAQEERAREEAKARLVSRRSRLGRPKSWTKVINL